MKKKSGASKKGSCLSFLTGCRDEASVELLRISLKKQGDRREKLERLLSRYEEIRVEQRAHIKSVKAAIIVIVWGFRN